MPKSRLAKRKDETARVRIAYDGEAVRAGSMDVLELAPALLAFAELLKMANASANGDQASVSVRVESRFRKSSFGIDLNVVQTLANTLVINVDMATALEVAKFVIGSGGVVGLIQLLRKLRGKKPIAEVPRPDGQMELQYLGDGAGATAQTLVINKNVYNLYGAFDARVAVERTLRPLEDEGIDTFKIIHGVDAVESIGRKEVPYFRAPDGPIGIVEEIADSTYEAGFRVIKPSFEEGLRWTLSDGRRRYGVDIEDREFLARVDRGEPFGKGDVLKVKVQQKSTRSADGELKTVMRVLKVLEHRPAARQTKLQFEPPKT
jgi:hypothetical protein